MLRSSGNERTYSFVARQFRSPGREAWAIPAPRV